MSSFWRGTSRLIALVLLCAAALQLYFLGRVALMKAVDPQSTAFQRSEAWRLLTEKHRILWNQQWVDYGAISPHLKRAVIASEDTAFTEHSGVDWDAMEKAWERNQRAEAQAQRLNNRLDHQAAHRPPSKPPSRAAPRIFGGSTITQQLAKNMFLGGERTLLRKSQEFLITLMLEGLLSKQRILEIYLNNVEWGEGLFGAQAAARHYFHLNAAQLGVAQASRLAVMLPAPKRFEKRPGSAYVTGRAATVVARMLAVELP
ncbi:MAG TPA: transglycosylase domain-containing protein [Burkholderiaceae bacterium]|nr:transglycosylase domain-containing protein [Burkholderiaceae bacterium]